MAWLSMSDMAGASTWVVSGEAGEVDLGVAGFGGLGVGQVADPEAQCANGTDGVAGQRDVDVEAGVGEGGLEQGAGGADGLVELAGDAATLLHGAERGEAFDALGAALLDAFDLVDLVADELEEAGHDLAQGGVEAGRASATAATSASNSARWSGSLIMRRKARWESRPWESQAAW